MIDQYQCDGRPVWSRTSDCQSGNPGSNPGRRIVSCIALFVAVIGSTCNRMRSCSISYAFNAAFACDLFASLVAATIMPPCSFFGVLCLATFGIEDTP